MMNKTVKTLLVCTAAEILNCASVLLFCQVLEIPLFLDTIFTVAITFYYGLVPGLCVSVVYNILNALFYIAQKVPYAYLLFAYTICGILIVLCTWLFSRNKDEFKISPLVTVLYLILIATTSSFCTIISSGIIDWFKLTYFNELDDVSVIRNFLHGFRSMGMGRFAACILAQAPVSFLDRLITTFAGYGVYKLAVRLLGGEGR